MRKPFVAVALCLLCVSAYAAEKEGVDPKEAPEFATLDADQDGYISSQEAGAWSYLTPELFGSTDSNHDGKLDEAEFSSLEANE